MLTPFPHTPIRRDLEQQGRILSNDWRRYTGGEVLYQPAKMSASRLQDLYYYAWDRFYSDSSQNLKMAKLFLKVIEKEKADGTYTHASPAASEMGRAEGNGQVTMNVLLISANVNPPPPIRSTPWESAWWRPRWSRPVTTSGSLIFWREGCSLEAVEREVRLFQPGLVGISVRNIDNVNLLNEQYYIDNIKTIVATIRAASGAKIVLGGAGFSLIPDLILKETGADYGVIGEGEALMAGLADDLERGGAPGGAAARPPGPPAGRRDRLGPVPTNG